MTGTTSTTNTRSESEPWWRDYPNGAEYQFMAGPAGGLIEWLLDISEPDRGLSRLCVFLHEPEPSAGASPEPSPDPSPDPSALRAKVEAALLELTEDPRCLDMLELQSFAWSQAEYVGGGPVTYCRPDVLSRMSVLEVCGGLHFAGAEYSPQYTGYVEGALRSGARAAERILDARSRDATLQAGGTRWLPLVGLGAVHGVLALATRTLRWVSARSDRAERALRGRGEVSAKTLGDLQDAAG